MVEGRLTSHETYGYTANTEKMLSELHLPSPSPSLLSLHLPL
jgi:hypothetical protein